VERRRQRQMCIRDRVEALGMIFEVIDMDNHRLDKILVMPKALPRPA
jgi:hypothetical protein